jgi:hypothetical protein
MAAKQGPNVLFFVPDRTKRILLDPSVEGKGSMRRDYGCPWLLETC